LVSFGFSFIVLNIHPRITLPRCFINSMTGVALTMRLTLQLTAGFVRITCI
jgi:hypothetical protein